MSDTKLRNFGFLLKDLSRRYVQRFERHARELSLTLPHCKVLVRLEDHEGASQARLAELTDLEPMAIVRILDRMEVDGLLERRSDPADRRARRLYLTLKAKPLLDQIWQISELTRAETLAGVSRAERDLLLNLLERMHANLCALDQQAPSVGDWSVGSARRRSAQRAANWPGKAVRKPRRSAR
jgi:MarR family transcriptional regulator for hemolysin